MKVIIEGKVKTVYAAADATPVALTAPVVG